MNLLYSVQCTVYSVQYQKYEVNQKEFNIKDLRILDVNKISRMLFILWKNYVHRNFLHRRTHVFSSVEESQYKK